MKNKNSCKKCGSTSRNLSKHHNIPKCHGGGKGRTILCRKPCHDDLEVIIQETEKLEAIRMGVITGSKRYRLTDEQYIEILNTFLEP